MVSLSISSCLPVNSDAMLVTPCDVSPRPRQAVNEAERNRIRYAVKNDRNRPGSVLCG